MLWLLPGLAGLVTDGFLKRGTLLPARVLIMFAVTLLFATAMGVLYRHIMLAAASDEAG
ncbi:hypothetical protein [Vreelandella malpeensis]|uniref:Uncharacterized protein n=1 Tax=Vreelandella malpeensis TaxID=1172368 RepID=A0ABS8DVY8_9GAMM|nr:hypothetical protein [Halomonas malpeensis]MCB8890423.1 hypothetical protein [Halomonas malpeensis]